MKVLLTGAGGFLGRRISRSLLAKGVVDLRLNFRQPPPPGYIEDLVRQFPLANIEWSAANLLARDALGAMVEGVDCIVHAAAGMRGAAADMFANTVVGSSNLMQAAIASRVGRVVLISSFAVYKTQGLANGAMLDESTPLEEVGVARGPYGYAKVVQERLVQDMARGHALETVILRPGVIYGPGGGALSARVGIRAMGLFFNLGGNVTLPLTYVDNCADAVAQATLRGPANSVFNVVDGDLPTSRQYLTAYRTKVQPMRTLWIPYWILLMGARYLERYHRISKGQLPALLTPYIVNAMYRPFAYSNEALRTIGWRQTVPTREALELTFDWLRSQGQS